MLFNLGGVISSDADMTFVTDTLTVAKLTVSTGPLTIVDDTLYSNTINANPGFNIRGSGNQELFIFETYTDDSNYSALRFFTGGGTLGIYSQAAGTGTARSITVGNAPAIQINKLGVGNIWGFGNVANRLEAAGNYGLSHGTSALATGATEGFFHIQSCAGTPTGTPASIPTGQVPVVIDSTNSKFYAYLGGAWKALEVAGVDCVFA